MKSSTFWYAAILITVALAVIAVVIAVFAGGAAAITQLTGAPTWVCIPVFVVFLAAWLWPKKGLRK